MAITKSKAATKLHIYSVLNDPDFIKRYGVLVDNPDRSKITRLLNDFGLELADFDFGNSNSRFAIYINPDTMFSAGNIEYDKNSNEFIVRFNSSINKEQFEELWILIERNKKKYGILKTKNKPPQGDDLLYAIFKAKMADKTLRETFAEYSCGTLPGYEGKSISQYHSEDELEKYYRRYYKPEL